MVYLYGLDEIKPERKYTFGTPKVCFLAWFLYIFVRKELTENFINKIYIKYIFKYINIKYFIIL